MMMFQNGAHRIRARVGPGGFMFRFSKFHTLNIDLRAVAGNLLHRFPSTDNQPSNNDRFLSPADQHP
jgi:hypothetical protein